MEYLINTIVTSLREKYLPCIHFIKLYITVTYSCTLFSAFVVGKVECTFYVVHYHLIFTVRVLNSYLPEEQSNIQPD